MSKTKNLIVKILIGIPASGKSTWCENFLMKNPDWLRVNRDDFRKMLRNEAMTEFRIENMITEVSNFTILEALNNKRNVLVDNTHLKIEYIEALVELVQTVADVEFQVFPISLEKAIERDANREKKVGEKVITRMFKEYKNLMDSYPLMNVKKIPRLFKNPPYDPNLPDAVIFDIDGTLAHMNGKRGPFDWMKVDVDDIDVSVQRIFQMHRKLDKEKIFCVSGRDSVCREKTLEWLEFYDVKPDALYMRPKDNFDKDNLIKEEIYNNHFKGKYNIIVVYDDRDQVVKMWRGLGLKVFQVNPGKF